MLSSLDVVRDLYVRPDRAQRFQQPAVALCVTGMQSRLMPTNLVTNLVAPNPMYSFDVLYVLDTEKELYYSSMTAWTYEPSPMAKLGHSELQLALESIPGPHRVHVLKADGHQTAEFWRSRLRCPKLDTIAQHTRIQDRVLSMYANQVTCAAGIGILESLRGQRYDYIVSAREDTFLFHALHLSQVLTPDCDLTFKAVLSYGGVNMRLQVMRREKGLPFLAGRLNFYQHLCDRGIGANNTEIFEKKQAQHLGMKLCALPVSQFPASAARHVSNGSFCFREETYEALGQPKKKHDQNHKVTKVLPPPPPPPAELLDRLNRSQCVPSASIPFVLAHLCLGDHRAHRAHVGTDVVHTALRKSTDACMPYCHAGYSASSSTLAGRRKFAAHNRTKSSRAPHVPAIASRPRRQRTSVHRRR